MHPTRTVSPPKSTSFSSRLRRSPRPVGQSPERTSKTPVPKTLSNVKTASITLSKDDLKAISSPGRSHSNTLSAAKRRGAEQSSPRLRSGGWTPNDYKNVDKLLKEAEDISYQMSLRNPRQEPVQALAPSQRKTLVARVIQRIRQSTGGTPDETRASLLSDSGCWNLQSGRETPTVRSHLSAPTDVEDEGVDHGIRRPPQPIPIEDSPLKSMTDSQFDEIFIATASPTPSYTALRDENRPPDSSKWTSRSDAVETDYKTLYEALQIRFRDEQVRTTQAKSRELEARLARKTRENEELMAQVEQLRRAPSPQRAEQGWMAVLQQEIQDLKSRVSVTEHHNKEIRSKLTS